MKSTIFANFAEHNEMNMENLPQDPYILLSYINAKLRDDYDSLDRLCDDLDVDRAALEDKLRQAGFEYSEKNNKFF